MTSLELARARYAAHLEAGNNLKPEHSPYSVNGRYLDEQQMVADAHTIARAAVAERQEVIDHSKESLLNNDEVAVPTSGSLEACLSDIESTLGKRIGFEIHSVLIAELCGMIRRRWPAALAPSEATELADELDKSFNHTSVVHTCKLALKAAGLLRRLAVENESTRKLLDLCCDAPLKLEIAKQTIERLQSSHAAMVERLEELRGRMEADCAYEPELRSILSESGEQP